MFEKDHLKVKVPIERVTFNVTVVIGDPNLILSSDNYRDHIPYKKISHFYVYLHQHSMLYKKGYYTRSYHWLDILF